MTTFKIYVGLKNVLDSAISALGPMAGFCEDVTELLAYGGNNEFHKFTSSHTYRMLWHGVPLLVGF